MEDTRRAFQRVETPIKIVRASLQGETARLPWIISHSHAINNSPGKQANIDLRGRIFKAKKEEQRTRPWPSTWHVHVRLVSRHIHRAKREHKHTIPPVRKSIVGCLKFLTRPPLLASTHIAQGPGLPPLHASTHHSTKHASLGVIAGPRSQVSCLP